MRLKKCFIYVVPILVICLSILLCINLKNNKNQQVIVIGNTLNINTETNINQTFTNSFMDSFFLLNLLENDASKKVDDKIIKLSHLIRQSSLIIVNIGKNDLNSNVNNNEKENNITFDIELLNSKLDKFSYNIKTIIYLIKSYNKNVNIQLLTIDYPYSVINNDLLSIYKHCNDILRQVAVENGVYIKELQ